MQNLMMRIEYDAESDMAYIYLTEIAAGAAKRTIPGSHGSVRINLDLDAEGHLLGIEVFDAGRVLPPELRTNAVTEPGA